MLVSQLSSELSPKLDLSIEGMRSQQFSEGVFAFLLIGIVVFSGIVIALMFSKNRPEESKVRGAFDVCCNYSRYSGCGYFWCGADAGRLPFLITY